MLLPRNTQHLPHRHIYIYIYTVCIYVYGLPVMAASTLLQLLKASLLSLREHLGGITQIFPHRDVNMWGVFERAVLGGCGRVLTLMMNISLVLRL